MTEHAQQPTKRVQKVAVVISLSRSGSTMLDLTLGAHPNIVGTGETYNFGRKWLPEVVAGLAKPCLCGADVSECELWGPVVDMAGGSSEPRESIERTYAAVVSRFAQLWPDSVMLDSSKKIESIRILREIPDLDVRAIFLVRDVRGWVASERDRRSKPSSIASMKLARGRSPLRLARRWREQNLRYLEQLDELDVPHLTVSYEQLCFQSGAAIEQIAEFLDVATPATLSPAQSNSHVVNGNAVRLDPERRSRLSYDTRWLRRLDAQAPYMVLRRVRRLNDRLVWDGWSPSPTRRVSARTPLRRPEPTQTSAPNPHR